MAYTQSASFGLADLLVTRFNKLEPLSEQERSVFRLIEGRGKHSHKPGDRLLTERTEIRLPHFIITGWAACVRELADGRRQIINLLLPGDAIGLTTRAHPLSPASVVALSPTRTVPASEITVALRDRDHVPSLAAALDLAMAEEEYFLLGHIVRLGRQTAYERIANLFMELDYRLSSRGLVVNDSFSFPLKQETLADAVGLSVVHVNRTLQQMRREGRIDLTRGRLSLLDREALSSAGEFIRPVLSASRNALVDGKSVHALAGQGASTDAHAH